MLYLLGRIELFAQVVAKLAALLEAIDRSANCSGGSSAADSDVLGMARQCHVSSENLASLSALRSQLIDTIVDLAHQLQSLEEDICYERKRLLEMDMAELCGRYWTVRYALQELMNVITSRHGARMPKLNPDPFGAELNLGLF